ncbi:MAG: IS110 family transposase [Gammaproteobacteria bacterium]|nr:IS110 family transposase [Gammaproteobacteria bacterium]
MKLESLSTISATTAINSGMNPSHSSDRDILASLPGVGLIVLAKLLGEEEGAIRNRDYTALRCSTGVAPVTKRSGKSCRVQHRRATNPRLVDNMYHGARVAAPRDPLCKQRYQALCARGHTHGRELRSVADRLIAVACTMLKTGTLYRRTIVET